MTSHDFYVLSCMPVGWCTVKQIQTLTGFSKANTYRILVDMYKSGKLDRKYIWYKNPTKKGGSPVVYYRRKEFEAIEEEPHFA